MTSPSVKWRIYYANSHTADSADFDPQQAESFGVVAVVFPDEEVGRVVMHGWDWYYYRTDHGQWWGSDIHGLLDGLLHNLPITAVKQGRNVDNKTFRKIMHLAANDPDFPKKSGRRPLETP